MVTDPRRPRLKAVSLGCGAITALCWAAAVAPSPVAAQDYYFEVPREEMIETFRAARERLRPLL